MVWRELKHYFDDCYLCLDNMAEFNKSKKKTWKYPNLESDIRPVAHSEELPVSRYTTLPDTEKAQDISLPDHTAISNDESCSYYEETFT